MKKIGLIIIVTAGLCATMSAQKKSAGVAAKPRVAATKSAEIGQSAIVIDETLSVLRKNPSLFSEAVHRMSRGRKVQILGVTEADGVKFYKVTVPPKNFGWVQADAVFGKFRASDEDRLSKLVQASSGFDQIEIAQQFFALYPNSTTKPALLLLYGDLLEEAAAKLSKEAASRLVRREMAASAAPMHSYYLNFSYLDRYRKLGVTFLFDPGTRQYHYDGASWKEVASRFATSAQAAEANKRLETLKMRMEKK
ncbi:MAG: SH3 domain-containing protein [Chloracidobacterium sp.]|nr:SH3 domain-containing protein [Chloracidobacterium sp.]